MRLTVGPLPPAVYWRRRAAVAVALALVIVLFLTMWSGADGSAPTTQPSSTGRPDLATSGPGSPATHTSGGTGSSGTDASVGPGSPSGSGSGSGGSGNGGADSGGQGVGNGGPPLVATVVCTDAEIALTAAVSPSPGIHGGVVTLTLIVRNTADHACLRDVGSGPQELQVRQGATVVWSSDRCDTPVVPNRHGDASGVRGAAWLWPAREAG